MTLREKLCALGYEDSTILDDPGFDNAFVGVTTDERVVYDYDQMVAWLVVHEGMNEDEAIDYINYNVVRALPMMGAYPPILTKTPNEYEYIT